jgi:plastocyanin
MILREETIVPGSVGPWVVRSEIRDQVMDDGKNWVRAELDYVVRTGPMTADVSAQGVSFFPSNLVVPAGTTVTWTNTDGFGTHTVTSSTPNYYFDSGFFTAGQSFSYTFVRPGIYTYFCQPHVGFGMVGAVTVTAGNVKTTGVTDMGAGGMYRFQMDDILTGTAIDVAYERRFIDWAGNVQVSEPTVVPVTGGGGNPGSFTIYGTGAAAANYMSIAGAGGTKIGEAMTVTTLGITQGGVFQIISLNQTALPFFGGVLLVDFFNQLIPFSFLPAFGGVATFNIVIPNDPAFVGLPVYFQTGIPDPGQAGGFAFSDGLELIIGL